ncbi:hypothetical protein BH11BAC2_BH11BAC2_20900 [soil metagenome]
MKQIIVFFLLILFGIHEKNVAQIISSDSLDNVSIFTTDALGKIYLVQKGGIIKTDPQGKILNTFNLKDYGEPFQLDARDPFKLLVFYRDFGMLRILDNQLGQQTILDLRQLGFADPRVICGTAEQSLWIYDLVTSQLSKLDLNQKKTQLSIDLRQLLGQAPTPIQMEQSQKWIAMLTDKEVLIFDQYGTFLKRIPLPDLKPKLFQLIEDNLYMSQGEKILRYNLGLNDMAEEPQILPSDCSFARISGAQILYIRNGWLVLPSK